MSQEANQETVQYLCDTFFEAAKAVHTKDYAHMYAQVERLFSETSYTESDLVGFVNANMNTTFNRDRRKDMGHYSGCLLELLTKRNRAEDKSTVVHIDGTDEYDGCSRFDYLFAGARDVGQLTVENLEGDYVCVDVGSFTGVDQLVLHKIKGNDTGAGVSSRGGRSSYVVFSECEGTRVGTRIGHDSGEVSTVLGVKNKGELGFSNLGYNAGKMGAMYFIDNEIDNLGDSIAGIQGEADFVFVYKNKGRGTLSGAAHDGGKIHFGLIVKNVGAFAAANVGYQTTKIDYGTGKGKANLMVIANSSTMPLPEGHGQMLRDGHIGQLVLHHVAGEDFAVGSQADELFIGEEAAQKYQEIVEAFNINHLYDIAKEKMKESLSVDDLKCLVHQLDAFYNLSIIGRPEFQELMSQ